MRRSRRKTTQTTSRATTATETDYETSVGTDIEAGTLDLYDNAPVEHVVPPTEPVEAQTGPQEPVQAIQAAADTQTLRLSPAAASVCTGGSVSTGSPKRATRPPS